MRRIPVCFFWMLLIPLPAMAQQEFPRAEVFGGYTYLRANPEGFNLHGWNVSVTGNLTHWFGVEADFSGHYGRPVDQFGPIPGIDINQHSFMGGPKLSMRGGPVTSFAHFLIGGARAGTIDFGESFYTNALATVIGGGVDINLTRTIAVRAAQVDYLMTRFSACDCGEHQNNFRFSAGLVIKLGNR